jgi:hypothetical protein
MQQDLGVKVVKKDRDQLVKLKFLEVTKAKRGALKLSITDAGWGWTNSNLDAVLPSPSSGRMTELLHQWLSHFHRYLNDKQLTIADVLRIPSQSTIPNAHEQVRSTYLAVTGGQLKSRCLLRDLRAGVPALTRDQVDDTIRQMVASGEAVLFRLDNRLTITPADVDAALMSGGEPKHILWIDR